MELLCPGMNVPGSRRFRGQMFHGAKVPRMKLLLLGAKVVTGMYSYHNSELLDGALKSGA